MISILIITKGHNSVKITRRVIVLVLCTSSNRGTKFCKNISTGFRVMERTRFLTDRRTDTQSETDRQTFMGITKCLPRRLGLGGSGVHNAVRSQVISSNSIFLLTCVYFQIVDKSIKLS